MNTITTHEIHGAKVDVSLCQFAQSDAPANYSKTVAKVVAICREMPANEFMAALHSDGTKAGSDALIKIDSCLKGETIVVLNVAK